MRMSIPYVETGRSRQKQRTRDALVESARALIGTGLTPTVEQAADEAGVSRSTAYRYFPNQRELLAAAHPQIAERSLLPKDPPADPHERLEIVLDGYLAMTLENEHALRTALALSLDPEHRGELALRAGRVIRWVEDALEPLRETLGGKRVGRLARAIRAAAGIESLVWLVDAAGMSRGDAVELMKWSAHALVDAAVEQSG